MLHHPCILGGPQTKGGKIRISSLNLAFSGVQKWAEMLHISGIPNKGDKIKAGPKEGGNATSTLHSRGSPTKGTKSKHQKKTNKKT